MKTITKCFLLYFMLLTYGSLYPQVGIGTIEPDISSILDISSNNKGLLMPRLTSEERDLITEPATGLMIYNITLNDGQLNIGTPSIPNWIGIKGANDNTVDTVTNGNSISTNSTEDLLVSGMTLLPIPGTYLVLFNAQMLAPPSEEFNSDDGVIAVNNIYNALMNAPGGIAHDLVFGNGETISPGVYNVTGAASIDGTLTIDGDNQTNPLFIIRSTGALTTGASTTVILTNGANARNIFWVSEGAISTGDTTIIQGTLLSNNNAVALGANTNIEGRMFSTTGALSMGANSSLTVPYGNSSIDLGVLSSFAMFTASGAISDCASCAVTGDVGTGLGPVTGFSTINGNVYPAGITTIQPINSTVIYSIFKNGFEVEHSKRTIDLLSSIVSLQSVVSVLAGESIEIRWKVDAGEVILNHRTLSLIRY